MFCHFWQKFENLKWPPFLWRGKFFEIAKSTLLGYPVGRKFRRIALCHTVKEIEANSCFAIFGEGKIFFKLPRVQCSNTLWVENFDKIPLSRTVKEIEANLCFAIFGKWQKFGYFLKVGQKRRFHRRSD